MSGRGKARTEKTIKKVGKKAGQSVSEESPRGYFEHRLIATKSKESIIQEWEGWMGCFSQSEFQVLRDVSAKVHNLEDEARSVLASRIVMNHKVNLLQESSKQVHIASKELTAMVRNAPAPLSTSGMTSDPHGKYLSTDVLFPPRMDSSSTVVASLSSSSSKSRERPGDYLVEAIKRRRLEKGPASFRSLVDIAHAMHFGIYEELPESTAVQDNISPRRQTLCRLSLSYLKKASDATKHMNPEHNLPLKDAFVSLSGIWSMFCQDANVAFKDDYEQGLDACAVKELDIADAGFAAVVAPLVEIAECAAKTDAVVKAQPIIGKIYELQGAPGSETYCRSLDALKTILKHAERPLSGRTKDASEGDAVSLWSAIFREQLPATACLALNLGEQGLAAARQSNSHLFRIFDIIAGTRKCDTILTVEDLEVANFELKKGLCTDVKDEIQLRRTIKAMKSIRMEATVFSMKELDDIWVAGPACDKILLPQTEAEVLDFMKNDMHRLFSLLFLYDRYSRDVFVKKAEYERQLRRGKKAVLPLSSEEMESRDLEWDLLVLNTPAKQAGRRKSIVDQLGDNEEEFTLSSPSDPYSGALKRKDDEVNTASKSRSKPRKPKAFTDRVRDATDDEEDELTDSDTC
ncbi:hypothetical protein BGZ89_011730 [Linnemannia elongata]|nr:hypothetical protein BGZ89_011730 [Linnemannia elongata]